MRGVDPAEVPGRGYLGRIRAVKRKHIVRAVLGALLLLAASPLIADCIANGHYTLASSQYPYTEDLTRPSSEPVPSGLWVSAENDWTLLQTACSEQTNVNASTAVALLIRASFLVRETTAAPDAMFDVQLRVDGEPIATHSRRVGDHLPKAYRFGGSVQQLPAGNHLLTMWIRMRDPGAVLIALQWITAQGAPVNFGGNRTAVDQVTLGAAWTMIGPPLPIETARDVDAALQASFTIASAATPLSFSWSLDSEPPGGRSGAIAPPSIQPDGATIFDHRAWIDAGAHTLQLWGRSSGGDAKLEGITIDLVGFPHETRPGRIPPIAEAEDDGATLATTDGDAEQPPGMVQPCGRWTKLIELELPPDVKNYSWSVDGFLEVLAHDVSSYGQIGVEVDSGDAHTDVGIFDIQAEHDYDGIYFYGDCSKWAPRDATHVSLWIRRVEGCGIAPIGGSFTVGKRWLAVKLLPSQAPHLP
jgi:hypothetical protein